VIRSWRLSTVACLLALVLAVGCGSDSDDTPPVEGPLPTGAEDPQAYTEGFMSRNPRALAQLEHLLIVELEPTTAEERDTCTEADGVDCIPYLVDEPTRIELSIDDDLESLESLVLVDDASGAVVLQQMRGDEASEILVEPGSYRLELHHASPGSATAPEEMVFVRPEISGGEAAPGGAAAHDTGTGAAPAPPTARLTAQKDCVQCNFSGALLEDESFDGLTLNGASFNRARVRNTTFRGAKMTGCTFLDLTSVYVSSLRGTTWETTPVDADFTGAVLSRAQFALRAPHVTRLHLNAVFRGATLDNTVWKGRRLNANDLSVLFNADFRNADLTDSQWQEELTLVQRTTPPNTPQCTFQGADLTRAKFLGRIREQLAQCRFDKEPESGRVTILRRATLSGANLTKAVMSDADLSEAVLEGTVMEGTDLSRAKVSGAKIAGVRWREAVLTDAVIAGIVPATLNGIDLTRTTFRGVDFAGLDLSRTDLSKAILDAAPKFAGATLTNGVLGINLAGQRFVERYAVFKGADLTGAELGGTELFQANLEETTLNNAKLVGANLNFANLRGAKLRGASLGIQPGSDGEAATLRGAFMPGIDLTDADLRSVDLTSAHLYGALQQTSLLRVRLDSATLANAICTGVRFSGTLNNTVFVGAQLVNTVFNDATLTGAKFDDAYLQGADFSAARSVRGTVLSNAAVSAAPGTWRFMEQDGTPFTFAYQATNLGALATDTTVRCPNGALGPCCGSGDLAACLNDKLKPVRNGPFPPIPSCVARPPRYDNCVTPVPTAPPTPTRRPQ
jgi:uncharacterized protein YjbI with pentapeptide repeats